MDIIDFKKEFVKFYPCGTKIKTIRATRMYNIVPNKYYVLRVKNKIISYFENPQKFLNAVHKKDIDDLYCFFSTKNITAEKIKLRIASVLQPFLDKVPKHTMLFINLRKVNVDSCIYSDTHNEIRFGNMIYSHGYYEKSESKSVALICGKPVILSLVQKKRDFNMFVKRGMYFGFDRHMKHQIKFHVFYTDSPPVEEYKNYLNRDKKHQNEYLTYTYLLNLLKSKPPVKKRWELVME